MHSGYWMARKPPSSRTTIRAAMPYQPDTQTHTHTLPPNARVRMLIGSAASRKSRSRVEARAIVTTLAPIERMAFSSFIHLHELRARTPMLHTRATIPTTTTTIVSSIAHTSQPPARARARSLPTIAPALLILISPI